jgi:hypothetical protein
MCEMHLFERKSGERKTEKSRQKRMKEMKSKLGSTS